MSRQMAFQLSELQYNDTLRLLVKNEALRASATSVADWLELIAADDEKLLQRLRAVLLLAVQCQKNGVDPMRVKKLVCWRNDAGEPGEIEAQLHGPQRSMRA